MNNEENIKTVKDIIMKYLVPKKEFDGLTGRAVAEEILKALEPKK